MCALFCNVNIFKMIRYFILGIIEGITEFFPISSTGHIILIDNFCSNINNLTQTSVVIMQLGAILSVLVRFRKKLYRIILNYISHSFLKGKYIDRELNIYHIFIGTIPGVVIGLLLYDKISLLFFKPIYIVYGLVLGNILLLIGEWYFLTEFKSSRCILNINYITYFQAFFIGCCQCLAFWPGFSRLGSTIGGGLLIGLNRKVASEFSFFLAIPITLGSAILTIYRQEFDVNAISIMILFVGFLSAFISALMTMNFFLKIVQNFSLLPFIIYRFMLATIIYCCMNCNSVLLFIYFILLFI